MTIGRQQNIGCKLWTHATLYIVQNVNAPQLSSCLVIIEALEIIPITHSLHTLSGCLDWEANIPSKEWALKFLSMKCTMLTAI